MFVVQIKMPDAGDGLGGLNWRAVWHGYAADLNIAEAEAARTLREDDLYKSGAKSNG